MPAANCTSITSSLNVSGDSGWSVGKCNGVLKEHHAQATTWLSIYKAYKRALVGSCSVQVYAGPGHVREVLDRNDLQPPSYMQ